MTQSIVVDGLPHSGPCLFESFFFMGVSGWMFLLVPAHPGSPVQMPLNGCVCYNNDNHHHHNVDCVKNKIKVQFWCHLPQLSGIEFYLIFSNQIHLENGCFLLNGDGGDDVVLDNNLCACCECVFRWSIILIVIGHTAICVHALTAVKTSPQTVWTGPYSRSCAKFVLCQYRQRTISFSAEFSVMNFWLFLIQMWRMCSLVAFIIISLQFYCKFLRLLPVSGVIYWSKFVCLLAG